MSKKPPFASSTEITAQKSIADISSMLVKAGAREISQQFDSSGRVVSVKFVLEVLPGIPQFFALPVRVEAVRITLNKYRNTSIDQAERVAWRQLFYWVRSQLDLIETGMVQSSEVFLPYMQDRDGQTMFESFIESKQKLLAAPEE